MSGHSRRDKKLGIVIPLANEETTIIELLGKIFEILQQRDEVFCIIDKASKDNTLKILKNYASNEQRLRVIWAPENKNVVDAYFRGYAEALEAGCDWILEMDGGMSHKPDHIPAFLDAMSGGYDFAVGSRFMVGGAFRGSRLRYCLSRGGTLLTNFLLKTQMADMTSGFECFSRDTLNYVIEHGVKSRGHFFQTEIRVMLRNHKWKEIPIQYKCTSNGVPQSAISESFANLWELYKEERRY